jgi:hypothetical protein
VNCIFWHDKTERLEDFLRRAINNENSFFYKNRDMYAKNYKIN